MIDSTTCPASNQNVVPRLAGGAVAVDRQHDDGADGELHSRRSGISPRQVHRPQPLPIRIDTRLRGAYPRERNRDGHHNHRPSEHRCRRTPALARYTIGAFVRVPVSVAEPSHARPLALRAHLTVGLPFSIRISIIGRRETSPVALREALPSPLCGIRSGSEFTRSGHELRPLPDDAFLAFFGVLNPDTSST